MVYDIGQILSDHERCGGADELFAGIELKNTKHLFATIS